MADTKISDLTATTAPATNDEAVIVDTSAGATRKVTLTNLVNKVLQAITGGVGIGESTIPAGATLAVGGGLSITDGAGGEIAGITSDSVIHSGVFFESEALTASVPHTIYTIPDNQLMALVSVAKLGGTPYAIGIVIYGSPTVTVIDIGSSGATISVSGSDIQVTTTSTGSYMASMIKLGRS